MNTTTVATAVQRNGRVTHARCCLLMLMGGSVVCMFCCLPVVCPGLCYHERKTKQTTFYRYVWVRTYKIGLIQRNPGNCLIHSRLKKNFERPPSYGARIELKPRPQFPDGLPVSTYLRVVFWIKVLVARDKFENRRKFHKYTYTYKAPLRGVGCSPRGDASWHATGGKVSIAIQRYS